MFHDFFFFQVVDGGRRLLLSSAITIVNQKLEALGRDNWPRPLRDGRVRAQEAELREIGAKQEFWFYKK